MSILYNPETRLLTLHTRRTTYQMYADEHDFLRHTYYGARADGADFRYLQRNYDRGFSGNPPELRGDRAFSLDTMPQEYTGFNAGDYRIAALCAVHADGSYAADLRYAGHEIRPGAYTLPGLPAAFDRDDGDSMTLVVTLRDMVEQMGFKREGVVRCPVQLFIFIRIIVLFRDCAGRCACFFCSGVRF